MRDLGKLVGPDANGDCRAERFARFVGKLESIKDFDGSSVLTTQ